MKRFFKVLLAAWITGAVAGGGCFAGAIAVGALVPKRDTKAAQDYAFVQSQIFEINQIIEQLWGME